MIFEHDDIVRKQVCRLIPLALRSRMLDRDDLLSIGRMAVIEATAQYEPIEGGPGIRTFVRSRVRQRLIDALRAARCCVSNDRGTDYLVPYARFHVDAGDEWRLPRNDVAIEDMLDAMRRSRAVHASIGQLTPQQGRVMARMIEGAAPSKIARELGIDPARVRQLIVAGAKNISRIAGIDLSV